MDVPSIIQMTGQAYKYAATYHTGVCVSNCGTTSPVIRFKLNLGVSNDLMNWHFVRELGDNQTMPRMVQVTGCSWILITHETSYGAGPGTQAPTAASFDLYYDFNDLMNGTKRATWAQPIFNGGPNLINGTPSVYDAHLALYNGYYDVDGQYGFHYNRSTTTSPTDLNAVTTVLKLFNPLGGVTGYPSVATNYNNLLISLGATGAVGQRDTLVTSTARYNLQEVNIDASMPTNFAKWRIWLYKFTESTNYPTGAGTVTALAPQTPNGSTSFGTPGISVIDRPDGSGKAVVISYYIFGEGAGLSEAGSLIYYFNI
jgi:hypothetical protein